MSLKEKIFLAVIALSVILFVALWPVADKNSPKRDVDIDWSKVEDNPRDKVEISWAGIPICPTAKKGSWIQTEIEKRFNVELKPIFWDMNEYNQKRGMLFVSGQVPDVNWEADPMPLHKCIDQGVVLELPYELLMKYCPAYVRNVNSVAPESWFYTYYKGKNYGIPTISGTGSNSAKNGVWRMDWLRNVGIDKVPDNLDEMHDAFYKFRYGDPDRNGVADTFGLCPQTHWSLMCNDVFCAYGILPYEFIIRNGKVTWGGIEPEAKQALALLHKWYKEGLIDPDFVSSGMKIFQSFMSGKLGYGYSTFLGYESFDVTKLNSATAMLKKLSPNAELQASPPILGIHGKRMDRTWGAGAHCIWFSRKLAEKPEAVIRVLKIFEAFASDREFYLSGRLGKRGVHWDYDKNGVARILPPYDSTDADNTKEVRIGGISSCFSYFNPSSLPYGQLKPFMSKEEVQFIDRYMNPDFAASNIFGKSDVLPSAGKFIEDLRNFQVVAYIEMIRGDKPLEYFDEFVKQWRKRGGDVLLNEAEQLYRERTVIFNKLGIREESSGK